MGDVFDQAAQADQPTDVFDAAAKAPTGGIGQTSKSFGENLSTALAGDDTHVPLTSYGNATEQGVLNVVQGTSQAVQGAASAILHPIDTVKGLVSSVKAAPSAITQVPAAIHDINQSKDPVGTYADVAEKTASQGAGQAIVAVGTEGLRVAGAKAIKAVKNVTGVPAALSQDTSSTLATVAHNEGLPPIASTTAREAADEMSTNFVNRAKSQYQVVDKAVGGDLKPVQERITQLRKAVKAQSNVNPELADKYMDELHQQQNTLSTLVEKAKANGVPNADQLMAAGDKDYARGMAMKDVSKGVKTASGIAKSGGHPNPTLFANQLDRLYNKGTLTRALGEDGAKAMLDTAKEGLKRAKNASTAKKVALAVTTGGVGAAGYHLAKSALSGQ